MPGPKYRGPEPSADGDLANLRWIRKNAFWAVEIVATPVAAKVGYNDLPGGILVEQPILLQAVVVRALEAAPQGTGTFQVSAYIGTADSNGSSIGSGTIAAGSWLVELPVSPAIAVSQNAVLRLYVDTLTATPPVGLGVQWRGVRTLP